MPEDRLRLRIAIIGAGPAGLSAAISLQQTLPFASVTIYEQATVLREIGTGLNIQPNTWRMLDVLGASKDIRPEEIFRAKDGHAMQHRNGRTGALLDSLGQKDIPPQHRHARALRSVLQKALLANVKVPIRLDSRLIRITESPRKSLLNFSTGSSPLILHFSNNHTEIVDFLIGADGVRSVVRQFAFPEYKLFYTGKTAYRGLILAERLLAIDGFPDAVTFWHGPGDWVYTCNLRHGLYELTCMAGVPEPENKSWGERVVEREEFMRPWKDFGPLAQEILSHATDIQRFPLYAGTRLETIVSKGCIALIGDASHRAGAAFALEDSYVLSRAISWAYSRNHDLSRALNLYDRVRSPHYKTLYSILDKFRESDKEMEKLGLGFDEAVERTVGEKWGEEAGFGWVYGYDAQKVWASAVREEDESLELG
ncbi:monooxygenase [Aspergillus recurvatus]